MVVREIRSKTILSPSKIYDYVINPYVGCQHGCHYCYARYMKKFSSHSEPWGEFVDVKMNAADLLQAELYRNKPGMIWISGVCDPYQPLEARFGVTGKCLEVLARNSWPVTIQTRSPLVLRDIDIIRIIAGIEVGLSVTTAEDEVRKLFEPLAPSIRERIEALDQLHGSGIRTFAMIAPVLPGAGLLIHDLKGKVDYILVDRMNYNYGDWVYRKFGMMDKRTDDFFINTGREIAGECMKAGIDCQLVF